MPSSFTFQELNNPRDKKLFCNHHKHWVYITQYATWHLLSNWFSISCSHFINLQLFKGLSRGGWERSLSFFSQIFFLMFYFFVCFNKKSPPITSVNFWKEKKSVWEMRRPENWTKQNTAHQHPLLWKDIFKADSFFCSCWFYYATNFRSAHRAACCLIKIWAAFGWHQYVRIVGTSL